MLIIGKAGYRAYGMVLSSKSGTILKYSKITVYLKSHLPKNLLSKIKKYNISKESRNRKNEYKGISLCVYGCVFQLVLNANLSKKLLLQFNGSIITPPLVKD